MGSYTHLSVAGYPLITSKSAVLPEVMTIFREGDRRVFDRHAGKRNQSAWTIGPDDDQETERAFEYSCTTRVAIDRLNIMGFTVGCARLEFEEGVRQELQELQELEVEERDSWAVRRCAILRALTFEAYTTALAQIIRTGLRPRPFEDSATPGLDPMVAFILDEDENVPFGYFGDDIRLLLRLACEIVDPESQVVQDITELVHAGYYDEHEQVCKRSLDELASGHPRNAPRIILTEGSSDGAILRSALSLLYPHLVEYYSFMDFDSSRAPGGASQLVAVVKAFAGAGITNRVIALFDNDTAARDAVRALDASRLPPNIAIRHYPPLDSLREYPTLGPTGLVPFDVNGLAASIELYLGDDVLRDGVHRLHPVQWKGYVESLKQYQGEVASKTVLRERYRQKVARCEANTSQVPASDWTGMKAILKTVFKAFD